MTGRETKVNKVWAMPDRNTFKIKPVSEFVSRYAPSGTVSIDPFARNSNLATYTNDMNPETSAQYHMEAVEFLRKLVEDGVEADVVLLDPPYSLHQVRASYDGYGDKRVIALTPVYDLAAKLCKPGGYVLNFGFNSNGLGKKRGFAQEEILLISHGGHHNDTICTAERRIAEPLD